MALRYIDGFDHQSSSSDNLRYKSPKGRVDESDFNGSLYTTQAGTKWGVGSALQIAVDAGSGFSASWLRKTFDNQSTWTIGFNFKRSSTSTTRILYFYAGDTIQCSLYIVSNVFKFYRGEGTTLLATGTTTINNDIWYWLEVKVTASNTVGSIEIRIDGTVDILETGLDTVAGADEFINRIALRCHVGQHYFDDLYIADGTAGLNDFIGESRIITLYPAGDDSVTWDRSAGATNASCVDETPVNATDYVSTSTPTEVDKYTLGALGVAGTVKGAQVCVTAKKDDAEIHTFRTTLRTGATDYNGDTQTLDAVYRAFTKLYPQNPNTLADWAVAEIDAVSIGQELVS